MSEAEAIERLKKTGRNDECPCGSGKKYKKCHLDQDTLANTAALKKEAEKAASAKTDGEECHDKECHADHSMQKGGGKIKPVRGSHTPSMHRRIGGG